MSNPKDPKSESWKRYTKYSLAHKWKDLIELLVTSGDEATRRKQCSTALRDVTFDALHGHTQWPQHEHIASRHYVEMDTARKRADREAAEQLAAEIKEEERRAAGREKHALPRAPMQISPCGEIRIPAATTRQVNYSKQRMVVVVGGGGSRRLRRTAASEDNMLLSIRSFRS
jgi:hypothetical protein